MIFGLFKCKHPFSALVVEKEHTKDPIDADFNLVTYHLYCRKCKENLSLKHAEMIGDVEAFFERGRQQFQMAHPDVKKVALPVDLVSP